VTIVEAELTAPDPGQIVVRTMYAGVNASDINLTSGQYEIFSTSAQTDCGFESTGEIVAVGPDVQGFKVGDHVMVVQIGGGFSEYQVLNVGREVPIIIPIPQATPEMTALMVNGLTASIGLEVVGDMRSNETVLITAAAGGVGHFAVQLAIQAGNRVIGTCSTSEKAAFLRELGCDRVINYRQENMYDVLTREYPKGLDLVFENVGREAFDTCVDNLAFRGRLVICGFISEYASGVETVQQQRIYDRLIRKSRSVRGFVYFHYPEHLSPHLQRLVELVTSGKLKVRIDAKEFHGIASCIDAVEHLHSRHSMGKVIVRFP
jgi:NADPH-dependent curcumin reductase CurA